MIRIVNKTGIFNDTRIYWVENGREVELKGATAVNINPIEVGGFVSGTIKFNRLAADVKGNLKALFDVDSDDADPGQ